jgi:membrane fusion protein (multidrug efflux system)
MMAKSVSDGLVRAPFEGVVSEKMVSPGEWVAPGRPLFTLVDDTPLKVELSIAEIAIPFIKENERIEIASVAHADTRWGATITRLGAEVGRTRSLIVEATIDSKPVEHVAAQPAAPAAGSAAAPATGSAAAPAAPASEKKLVPGMFVEAHVRFGQKDRIVLPKTALKPGKTPRVFVVRKGELEERLVQLGPPPAADTISIEQGVEPGEKVVAAGVDKLVDGAPVVE